MTDIQLTTFGQPRIGNAAFVHYFSKRVPRTVRVTHANDIVPHLPPYYSYFERRTYHHFPREVTPSPKVSFRLLVGKVSITLLPGWNTNINCPTSTTSQPLDLHKYTRVNNYSNKFWLHSHLLLSITDDKYHWGGQNKLIRYQWTCPCRLTNWGWITFSFFHMTPWSWLIYESWIWLVFSWSSLL